MTCPKCHIPMATKHTLKESEVVYRARTCNRCGYECTTEETEIGPVDLYWSKRNSHRREKYHAERAD